VQLYTQQRADMIKFMALHYFSAFALQDGDYSCRRRMALYPCINHFVNCQSTGCSIPHSLYYL